MSSLTAKLIQIAGSASPRTDPAIIRYAQDTLCKLAGAILAKGGGLVLSVGREPTSDLDRGAALVFDWTLLEAAIHCLQAGRCHDPSQHICVVTSSVAVSKIPDNRRELWNDLLTKWRIRVEFIQAGSRSGALIRLRQAQLGDNLVIAGGGTGVEHLAELYLQSRRSVIPLDLPLGASREDGFGGAQRLASVALSNPADFLQLSPEDHSNAGSLLSALMNAWPHQNPEQLSSNIVRALEALRKPAAFFVRLLNKAHPDFNAVERFFRKTVDPVVDQLGFRRIEVGTDPSQHAFMNMEIFENLHWASVAVVDITGTRPNCFIELGYSLGRQIPTIVTAKEGTLLPFDQQAIPCFFWSDKKKPTPKEFMEFWAKNVRRAPLVA